MTQKTLATILLTVLLVAFSLSVYLWPGPLSEIAFPNHFSPVSETEVPVSPPVFENAPILVATDLERISPRITGPRVQKPHLRALLTIPIGKKSVDIINGTIYSFLNSGAGRVMLFAYDSFDWSTQSWYDDERIIFVRHLKQMKWWFIKRFVTPVTVEAYDYLWFSDDDAAFDWNPNDFMDILDQFKVEMAQPSHIVEKPCSKSSWAITHKRSVKNGGGVHGRWTNFVECGPLAIIEKNVWKRCMWNFLQEDLTSGVGLDEMWYDACKPKTAVIDKYSMCHKSTRAASSTSKSFYDPGIEWPEYKRRFPNVNKSPNDPNKNFIGTF